MSKKIGMNLLGGYDLILALGAIFVGIMMISSKNGIFIEYPKEWLSKVPFGSWVIAGIIIIVLFGLGNIIAAIFSFRKNNKSGLVSGIMGGIFFLSLVVQVIILGEWYLATVEFFLCSIIQICLSTYVFVCFRKN